jgi:hypothetical protein
MARFLIVLGLAILVIGLLWPYLSQIGLGRLPGDVVIDTIMRLTRPTHPFRAAMLHPTRTLLGRVALARSPGRGLLLSSGSGRRTGDEMRRSDDAGAADQTAVLVALFA